MVPSVCECGLRVFGGAGWEEWLVMEAERLRLWEDMVLGVNPSEVVG